MSPARISKIGSTTRPRRATLDLDSDSIRTRLDIGFGEGYTLSYIGGYAEFSQAQMYGNEPQGDTRNTVDSSYEGTQHELQLTNPSEARLQLHRRPLLLRRRKQHPLRHAARKLGLHASGPGHRAVDVRAAGALAGDAERVSAGYVQGHRLDLRLTAGARYIDDTREDKGGRSIDCTFGLRGALPNNLVRNAAALNGAQGCYYRQYNDMKGDWSKTTWMARGEYDLTDSVMMYLSYETGWKSGVLQDGKGYDDLVTSGGTLDFSRNNSLLQKPEEVNSIEFGVKTDFSDWRLSANVFYMEFSDMQVTGAVIDPVTGQSTLTNTNAGGATIKGLELEASAGLFNDAGQLAATLRVSGCDVRRVLRQRIRTSATRAAASGTTVPSVFEPSGACVGNVFNFAGNNLPYAPEVSA